MQDMLLAFSGWLADTSLSEHVRAITWIVPLMQTIHLLGIATVMGTIVLIDLRVLGLAVPSQRVPGMVRRLLPTLWIALAVLLLTGSVLVVGEPNRSVVNPAFQLKMALLVAVVALTLLFAGRLRADETYWEVTAGRRGAAKLIAAVSLGIWLAIAVAGRMIAYVELG